MKYSIIIVAYKAQDHYERCIESIAYSDIDPAETEVVVIDNSPEPMGMYLPGGHAFHFQYQHLPTNPGFAAGCNIGAAMARGEILVFLNPDTLVYGDWLHRLARQLSWFGGRFGAVGPMSNAAAGQQGGAFRSQDVGTREDWPGIETKMLIGFCLMLPKQRFDAVGGMDASLVLGCDDLDLSLRLREAGYSLGIASDCYVHHAFHKSFEANPEAQRMQRWSEDAFRAKLQTRFSGNPPSSEELWGCDIFYTGLLKPQTLSVVLIVRAEEENLRELLPQLAFADQVVIVDTFPGRDPDIQAQMPKYIVEWCENKAPALARNVVAGVFPWCEDFAAARNYALSLATMDWVLWLDADDRVPETAAALISAALDRPGPLTAQRKCHFSFSIKSLGPRGTQISHAQPRMFPNLPGMAWEQRIHENYAAAAGRLGLTLVTAPNIEIIHTGYQDPEVVRQKHERNLRILGLEPDSPHRRMHMGNEYMAIGEIDRAREEFLGLLSMTWHEPLEPDLIEHIRYMVAITFHKQARFEAMDPYIRGNRKPDALFLRAEAAFYGKRFQEAKALYQDYLGLDITDYYGTNVETMQAACVTRIEAIEKLEAMEVAVG